MVSSHELPVFIVLARRGLIRNNTKGLSLVNVYLSEHKETAFDDIPAEIWVSM